MKTLIEVADCLVADKWITKADRAKLIVKDGLVHDDSKFPVELCENGDVYLHKGAYPYMLPRYAKL